jgi:hypothetical protein
MRYYALSIFDPDTLAVWQPNATNGTLTPTGAPGSATFSSHTQTSAGLRYNPGGLNIEFDIPVVTADTPQGLAEISVSGVGLQMIGQLTPLANQNLTLSAGMQLGIAGVNGLANPAQAGIVVRGKVYQAFGNWQGTNQTLDLAVLPTGLPPSNGIAFQWSPGQSLGAALYVALAPALPQYKLNINVNPNLATSVVQSGYYTNLSAFADVLRSITQPLEVALTGNPTAPGVLMNVQGNSLLIFDTGSTPTKTVQLNFQDLIGQPTWLGVSVISFKTVLRSDITIGTSVVFPTGVAAPYALTSPTAAVPGAPARSKTVFQGAFSVRRVQHFANLRQYDADSWTTAFEAVAPS